jgi:hypothetical protein
LLIVGGASAALDEAESARDLGPFDAVMAINDAIALYPAPLDYAVTLHPDKLRGWLDRRAKDQRPGARPELWSDHCVGTGNLEPDQLTRDSWAGSSGLFAVKVGLIEGFERIVLAGVPMQAARGHIEDAAPWTDCSSFTSGWHIQRKLLGLFVRSMSGWTAELLGKPTRAWLAGKSRGRNRPPKEETG